MVVEAFFSAIPCCSTQFHLKSFVLVPQNKIQNHVPSNHPFRPFRQPSEPTIGAPTHRSRNKRGVHGQHPHELEELNTSRILSEHARDSGQVLGRVRCDPRARASNTGGKRRASLDPSWFGATVWGKDAKQKRGLSSTVRVPSVGCFGCFPSTDWS